MASPIGIIPRSNQTFEVYGDLSEKEPVEGGLYYDQKDGRIYYYSKSINRSNPKCGFFPIWDGSELFISKFSIEKYYPTDVTTLDLQRMGSSINKEIAEHISYMHRLSDNNEILTPAIADGDNMFTQCIKGVISMKKITMVDLFDMCDNRISPEVLENYYHSLTRITFMRLDKWNVWLNWILHIKYRLAVFQNQETLVVFEYPDTWHVDKIENYQKIIDSKDDQLKKIIKILIQMKGLNKSNLKTEGMDDYTVNNMMTTIGSGKSLSAQLFSRFIHMADMSYQIEMIENDNVLFEYHE